MNEGRAWKNNLHLRRGVRQLLRHLRVAAPLDLSGRSLISVALVAR